MEPVFTPIWFMWRKHLASRPMRVVHPAPDGPGCANALSCKLVRHPQRDGGLFLLCSSNDEDKAVHASHLT